MIYFHKFAITKKYRNLLLQYSYSFHLGKNLMNHVHVMQCFYGPLPQKALTKNLTVVESAIVQSQI